MVKLYLYNGIVVIMLVSGCCWENFVIAVAEMYLSLLAISKKISTF